MSALTPVSKTAAVRVFISYSWDDEDHKKWALAFANKLRADGIDAIIDQTHLQLGERTPEFMERSVRDSDRVLVICTEVYKQKFDGRKGGAGYEGNITTGEILSEVGKTKFIPILRRGDWNSALPTALSGVFGVDLRKDSPDEYRKLIEHLHGISKIPPVGPRPAWVHHFPASPVPTAVKPESDPQEYWDQRKRLPETDLLKKIWSKPHWKIWIRATEFKPARFQNTEQCRQFILSSEVLLHGWFPFPSFSPETIEIDKQWVAGEAVHSEDNRLWRAERWVLFQSGQFVQNRSFDEIPQLGDRLHVLDILDTVTAGVEFAARMAERGVLSTRAAITFDLIGVAGRSLTWPQDSYGDRIAPNFWCQDNEVRVERRIGVNELKAQRREIAIQLVIEICNKFGCTTIPKQDLMTEQSRRFGAP